MFKTIYLLCDQDCDGFLSSSLFYIYIKKINKNINIIPIFHEKKTHGLSNLKVLEFLKTQTPSLLIIPDAGANDNKECVELKNIGWKICIFEHHIQNIENNGAIVVNNQTSKNVKNKYLSGTGVTWKVLSHFDKIYGYNYANSLISYVAISIISDSMSLLSNENRLFIKYGLKKIHPNIKPFVEEFIKEELTPNAFSFNLINRFNAIIRSDNQEAKKRLFYSLCGENKDCKQVIKDCKLCHTYQKTFVKDMVNYIIPTIDSDEKIIIAYTDIHSAYTGLVANQLMSKYNKSILLVHEKNNCYEGSARSPIELKSLLEKSGIMTINSGHEQALGVGWKIEDTEKLKKYISSLDIDITPAITVLQSFQPNQIPFYLFSKFNEYSDLWGMGLAPPKYHIYNIKINSSQIKEIRYNAMISFYVNNIEFVKKFVSKDIKQSFWHMDESIDLEIECIGELSKSDYNGKNVVLMDKVEIKIIDEDLEDIFK